MMGADYSGGSPAAPLTPDERNEVIHAAMIRAAIHAARGLDFCDTQPAVYRIRQAARCEAADGEGSDL